MEVILLEKVGKLGVLGDKVNVKPGFGRNYLIPQGKAVAATADNLARFEERRAELEAAAAEALRAATARAESLQEQTFTITATAGEEGKLFGSVGARDIAEAVSASGTAIDKSEVRLPEGVLRQVGSYEIVVQLHAEVAVTINLTIAAE